MLSSRSACLAAYCLLNVVPCLGACGGNAIAAKPVGDSGGTGPGAGSGENGGANIGVAGEGSANAATQASGAAGGSGCSGLSQTRSSQSARSAGFSGSYQTNYYPLYSLGCSTVTDCSSACVTAGGTPTSCSASECITGTQDYCLPPTYWFDLDRLLIEGNSIDSSAWIIMVDDPYQDQLLATNFQFEIPTGATIQGIEFAFNESADLGNSISDSSVRVLVGGAATGLDRRHSTSWTDSFHYAVYGGPNDLWGTTLTPDAIDTGGFGVGLTLQYLSSSGNARAYVDFIRATVYYETCE